MTALEESIEPKVSVILPVRGAEDTLLHGAMESVLAQTFKNFEVIFADLSNDSHTLQLLQEYTQQDQHAKILSIPENDAASREIITKGAALNAALDQASGEYLFFMDAFMRLKPNFLESATLRADDTAADIIACETLWLPPQTLENSKNGSALKNAAAKEAGGNSSKNNSKSAASKNSSKPGTRKKTSETFSILRTRWLHGSPEVFNRRDCPDRIMNVINPDFWCALYRSSFLSSTGLRFKEESSAGIECAFRAVCAAAAGSITFIADPMLSRLSADKKAPTAISLSKPQTPPVAGTKTATTALVKNTAPAEGKASSEITAAASNTTKASAKAAALAAAASARAAKAANSTATDTKSNNPKTPPEVMPTPVASTIDANADADDADANSNATAERNRLMERLGAVSAAQVMLAELPYAEECDAALTYFSTSIYLKGLFDDKPELSSPATGSYYETIQAYFLSSRFASPKRENCKDDVLYNRFQIVRKYDFEKFKALSSTPLVVSLTSFPPRIDGVAKVLKTILNQTLKADEIVLWLAEADFPEKFKALPADLNELCKSGKVTIKWCKEDLKPHNKYFHAFKAYPDAFIVTIDDDVYYEPDLLQLLYDSSLLYPHAVSATRAHLACVSEEGKFIPMKLWPQEVDGVPFEPAVQLWAVGAGGALYPPHLFSQELLDAEAIRQTCLFHDDMWLKVMELMADIPVVLACRHQEIHFLPGSQQQQTSLGFKNAKGRTMVYMGICSDWINQKYHDRWLEKKLLTAMIRPQLTGDAALNRYYKNARAMLSEQLQKAEALKAYQYALIFIGIDESPEGDPKSELELIENSDSNAILTPKQIKGGRGVVIHSSAGELKLKFRCKGHLTLRIKLGGPDIANPDWAGDPWIPIIINYRFLYLNDEPVFFSEQAASYGEPYQYHKECNDGDTLAIRLSWDKDLVIIGGRVKKQNSSNILESIKAKISGLKLKT